MAFKLFLLANMAGVLFGDENAERLHNDLLDSYNKMAIPVEDNSKNLTIRLGVSLIRIINVDEKNQVLTTNVWLEMEWLDWKLSWDPVKYGGIEKIHIPSTSLWLPDVILYNNAAGFPAISIFTDATVYDDGTVNWKPPAIYKSFCDIDVTYFPYDEQECIMKFGLWTHWGNVVDMRYHNSMKWREVVNDDGSIGQYIEKGMDLSYYIKSGSWDLMNVTGMRNEVVYEGCCGTVSYVDISYKILLRRKPLFFTANLVVPCVLISFLAIFVFYLPADSKAKLGFTLSILVTMCVFFLVLIDLIPPTSKVVPLFGKYVLFSVVFISCSAIVSVIVVNIHCRGKDHKMPPWVHKVFLELLPRILKLKPFDGALEGSDQAAATFAMHNRLVDKRRLNLFLNPPVAYNFSQLNSPCFCRKNETRYDEHKRLYLKIFSGAISNVQFIMQTFKTMNEEDVMSAEWMYVASVIDRLMLFIFSIAFFVGTFSIVLTSPAIYDFTPPLELPAPTGPLGGDTRDLSRVLSQLNQMSEQM